MADIFISYDTLDRPTVHWLAEALEAHGWSVWWDNRGLRGGEHFPRTIEKEISKARVVIVIWSQNSIDSDWVLDEAALGLEQKKLVPVRIDMANPPLWFRNIHTLDLSSWTRESEAEPFEKLLETLSHYLGSPKKAEQPKRPAKPRSQTEPTDPAEPTSIPKRERVGKYLAAILVIVGVLTLGVSMGVLWGRPEVSSPESPTEATVSKPPASTEDVVAGIQAAYERGDYETAFSLARPAAEQGDAFAQTNLGMMYEMGRGAPQDDAEAVHWYQKAAEQGDAWAQFRLGLMYEMDRGVPRDDAEAARWYQKAAKQWFAPAQSNLGVMYAQGCSVPRDDAQAVQWLRRAAEQGQADAQTLLDLLSAKERR